MSFSEERKKAFDFCADAIKQLITLATGIITVTITFAKDFVTTVSDSSKPWAYWAWFVYLASIICGMFALLALTAELQPKQTKSAEPSIRGAAATWSFFQIILFGIAIFLTIMFAIKAVNKPKLKPADNTESVKKIDTIAVKLDTLVVRIDKKCKYK